MSAAIIPPLISHVVSASAYLIQSCIANADFQPLSLFNFYRRVKLVRYD